MPDPITSEPLQSLVSFLLSVPITRRERDARNLYDWCKHTVHETFKEYAIAATAKDTHAMIHHSNMALALTIAAESLKAATHHAVSHSLPPLPEPDATAYLKAYGITPPKGP